jgi:hypothetical protein
MLVPDASPHSCEFSAADIACDADTDCVAIEEIECGCVDPIYGANKMNMIFCIPPPCAPPAPGTPPCDPDASFVTQDCRVTKNVGVSCVQNQCVTHAQ